jgi:hypothetical protein
MSKVWAILGCLAVSAFWAGAEGQQVNQEPTTATAPAMPAGVNLVVVLLEETRRSTLVPSPARWTVPSELKVTLNVVGDTAAKASRCGRVKIDQAEDDTGQNLVKAEPAPLRRGRESLETIDEWKRRGVANGFSLELHLVPASRQAAKIARIDGAFVIMVGGRPVEATIKNAASLVGKEVESPALAAAGIKIKITDQTEAGRQIAFVVEENEDAVLDADLVDEAGKVIKSVKGWSRMGDGPTINTLAAQGKLPENAGLKVNFASGAKVLTVPIALRDVALP